SWKTNNPLWVSQWPQEKKLSALKELFKEQLQKGHIKETNSPSNSPAFVNTDSWRLLHDLRRINEVIEDMGPLQPGLPSLSVIPRDWPLVIIDLKDCFFNTPLHPDDAPQFAFSIPSINRREPPQRYHCLMLPQVMKNSPTTCQWFVAQALSPARQKHLQAMILHYMDDLFIAASTQREVEEACDSVITAIQDAGLEVSTSKIQETLPWKYLGWRMTEKSIRPQKIQLRTKVNTLQDLQQLLGEINWIRSVLGITNDELAPVFDLLRGDCDITSPRSLIPKAQRALKKVIEALQQREAHQCIESLPFFLAVLWEQMQLYGLIFQWDSSKRDPLLIIEWIFLPYRSPKTIFPTVEMMAQIIIRARERWLTIAGQDFAVIYVPLKKEYFDWTLQKSEDLQIALLNYPDAYSIHFPRHKLLQAKLSFRETPILSEVPLEVVTVFSDGSGKTHKSVITWQNQTTKRWESGIQMVEGSHQVVELAAVVRAFLLFPEPFNLITDSAYVANIVKRIEGSVLKDVSNNSFCRYLMCLYTILQNRTNPYFISHIRTHTSFPGF
ncbi:POK11 protein, partial [Vireo altiloquus]|nr:POK11 protein [Vireo altiloquus]